MVLMKTTTAKNNIADAVIRVIGMMTRGQKVLIQEEEKEEKNDEEKEEEYDEEQTGEENDEGEKEKGGRI